MYFLGSEKREPLAEVESHLISENTLCPYSCPVILHYSVFPDMSQQIKVLFHNIYLSQFLIPKEKIIASL